MVVILIVRHVGLLRHIITTAATILIIGMTLKTTVWYFFKVL